MEQAEPPADDGEPIMVEEAEPPEEDAPRALAQADAAQAGPSPPAASGGLETGDLMQHWARPEGPYPLDGSLFTLEVHLPPPRSDASLTTFASLSGASLLSKIPAEDKKALVSRLVRECPRSSVAKAVGSMVALAAADATGHWFEFMDACDKPGENYGRSLFDVSKLEFAPPTEDPRRNPPACFSGQFLNRFSLQMGQWTDDCSMSLCMADSLLVKQRYDGSDIRIRFWSWWNRGYCNAFGKEAELGRPRSSVGLGGNISKSIFSMREREIPTPSFESSGEDSGNGSLMRLAPIAIFHSSDERAAMHYARESSYTTHPGKIAAECCALQAFLIARAIQDPQLPIEAAAGAAAADGDGVGLTARAWLEKQVDDYLETVLKGRDGVGVNEVRRLLLSAEPEGSLERCVSEMMLQRHTRARTRAPTHAPTHSRTHTYAHTHTHARARAHARTRTHTHTRRCGVAGTGTGARLQKKGSKLRKPLSSAATATTATQFLPAILAPTPWTAWRWHSIALAPRTVSTLRCNAASTSSGMPTRPVQLLGRSQVRAQAVLPLPA